MADEEYFVREADSETARGPYDFDKLVTLGEARQISPDTLYYDDEMEAWTPIRSNNQLFQAIFPEKKKLSLKPRQTSAPIPQKGEDDSEDPEPDTSPAISVDEMLAAAEGETEETEHVKEQLRWQERAAQLSLPALAMFFILSAVGLIYASWDTIALYLDPPRDAQEAAGMLLLLKEPKILFGLFDLIVGILLLLSFTGIYPLLRFRLMLGLGYFGFLHYANTTHGEPAAQYLLLCALLGSIAAFILTLTLRFGLVALCALLAIAASLGQGFLLNFY